MHCTLYNQQLVDDDKKQLKKKSKNSLESFYGNMQIMCKQLSLVYISILNLFYNLLKGVTLKFIYKKK